MAKTELDSGTYEILRGRLDKWGKELNGKLTKLNEERKSVFGNIENKLLATERVTTDNNCVPRDMISIQNYFIFGYNVHIGLRSETSLSDVFSIYEFENQTFKSIGLDKIQNEIFEADFKELYKYYKNTNFEKFSIIGTYLYMVFRVGKGPNDFKTFKWLIKGEELKYEGNRSDHEFKFPPQFEFDWKRTSRDYHRKGKYPHISVLDKVFIETVGGDLTIKIEDNTDSGEGIYHEAVEDKDQQLDDAEIFYADLGNIILLKIKPFKEKDFRYIIYNDKIKKAQRIDAIKDSCILLPDDQGIVFSKGYYLQTGEHKIFDNDHQDLRFEKRIQSPNGEDFMYIFYNFEHGIYILIPYNIIQQRVDNITICHGYSIFPDGELIYFMAQPDAAKHHVIQLWQTPFVSLDYVPPVVPDSYLYKIGNKEIVRCMAECSEVLHLLEKDDEAYANLYLDIVKITSGVLDSYFWIKDETCQNLAEALVEIKSTAYSAIEEFDKVVRIKKNTQDQLSFYLKKCEELFGNLKRERFADIDAYVNALAALRTLRGELISLKELRYIDIALVEQLESQTAEQTDKISKACVEFLLNEKALSPYQVKIEAQKSEIEKVGKVLEAKKIEENIAKIGNELEMLIEIVNNLKIEDATQTTRIIDNISLIFSELNQLKAQIKNKKKELSKTESTAEFHAQIKLVDQSIINFIDISDSPEKCDEYLSRIMIQLEELEGKVAEFDEFISVVNEKREEIYEAFENKKLVIVEARNNRANALLSAAERVLNSAQKRIAVFKTAVEINGYFASDLMIDKVRDIIKQLENINDNVKADDIQSKLKTLKEDALRQLKDKQELFVGGENVLKLGKYHFSVNTQPLDLTVVHKNDDLFYHLTGTNFYEKVTDGELLNTREVWNQVIVSENEKVYRGEYLANLIYQDAVNLNLLKINDLLLMDFDALHSLVQQYMAPRYSEGYIKGVSDKDAAIILKGLVQLHSSIDLLRYSPLARSCAKFFWNYYILQEEKEFFNNKLKGIGLILKVFPETKGLGEIHEALKKAVAGFLSQSSLFNHYLEEDVCEYLFFELIRGDSFIVSVQAAELSDSFKSFIKRKSFHQEFDNSIKKLEGKPESQMDLVRSWLRAFTQSEDISNKEDFLLETSLLLLDTDETIYHIIKSKTDLSLDGFSGSHSSIEGGKYILQFNAFTSKMRHFQRVTVPYYHKYLSVKNSLIEREKTDMRLNEFKPRVLSSFVRNKLIDELYLHLIGANLAKQIGVVGEGKRTDLMGMLLLISPPGYGKTTIMEYIASRLGIIFMKINGPAIGHKITSVDPSEAHNASAREELEKLNLAFEMGDNVMIYLDDIQHCNPEFLQKFISLCDAQRKIEGVYKGRPKTYDFRGKKVCVVMAGNPYTESGDKFQIPDMLANRADTYNLGDIIGDKEDVFKLSYIENCLTSNAIAAKVANKSLKDIYSFLTLAETGDKTGLDFEGTYSAEEANEIVSVLNKLKIIREVILKVNLQYIESASQADEFRTEPPFKLQGSYRNMNKLAEKVVPIMNDNEVRSLVLSHYQSESQTLTTGAEANLLKFKDILGWMDGKEHERWEEIKTTFRKNQKFKGIDSSNQMGQLLMQLSSLGDGVEGIKSAIEKKS